jgi:hypothetical protein
MAIDPNAEVPQFTGYMDDPETWPATLPEGVTKDPAVWYAHRRTYADGRTVWEFRKRGSGDGPVGENGKPGDKVVATVSGMPIKSIKEAYDKEKEKADDDAKPPGGLPERTVNGVVMQWNPQTRAYDIPTGQAPTAAPSTTQRQEWQSEGTPLPGGGHDNSKPIMAEYINGKRTGRTRAPTADELKDWNEAGQRTRNPGNKSDAEMAAEKKAADDKARQTRLDEEASARASSAERRATAAEQRAGQEEILQGRGPNGEDVRVIRGPDGKVLRYEPVAGGKTNAPPPAGGPKPSGRMGEAASDLQAYDEWLDKELRRPGTTLTAVQADKMREARRAFWKTALEEELGIINTQRGIFTDQTGQRRDTLNDQGNRRTNATSIANGADDQWMQLATKGGTDPNFGSNLMAAIENTRRNNMDFVTMSGANRMVPEIPLGPALVRAAGLTGPTKFGGGEVIPTAPPAFMRPNPAAVPPTGAEVAAQNAAIVPATSANLGRLAQPPTATGAPAPMLPPQPVAAQGPNPATPNLHPPAPSAPAVMPPTQVPDVGPTYSPQMASVAPGSTGTQHVIGTPPPPPQAAPFQDEQQDAAAPPLAGATTGADPLDEEIVVRHFLGQEIPVTRREYEAWPWFKKQQYTYVRPTATTYTQAPSQPSVNAPAQSSGAPQSMMNTAAPTFMRPRPTMAVPAAPDGAEQEWVKQWMDDPDMDNGILAQVLKEKYPQYDTSHLTAA